MTKGAENSPVSKHHFINNMEKQIIELVCEVFKVRYDYLMASGQNKLKTQPRMAIAILLKEKGRSFTRISKAMQKEYKSYSQHYYYKGLKLIEKNPEFNNKLNKIRRLK